MYIRVMLLTLILLVLFASCAPQPQDDTDVGVVSHELRECPEGEQLGYVPPTITCVPVGTVPIDSPCDSPDACEDGAACVPDIGHSDRIAPDRYILGQGVCRTIADRGACEDGERYQTLLRTDSGAFDTLVLFSLGDVLYPVMRSEDWAFGFCIRTCDDDCPAEPMFCGKDHEEDPEPTSCRRRNVR